MNRIISIYISFVVSFIVSTGLLAQEGIMEKFIHKPEEKLRMEYEFSFAEAGKQKMKGNLIKAKEFYNKCIELRPQRPTPYYELASIAFFEEETLLAKAYIEKAIELDPDNEWFKYLAIEIATKQEMYIEGADYYRQLARQFPEKSEYLIGEIDMLLRAKDEKTALKKLDELEKSFGFSKYTAIRKKELYLAMGKDKQAYNELERLIEKFPDDVEIMGILAELYAEKGEEEKALALFDKMKLLNSGNPLVYFSLGKYYFDLGRKEEAIAEFQTGFASRDVNPEIKIQVFMELLRLEQESDTLNDNLAGLLEVLYKTDKGNAAVDVLYADYLFNTQKEDKAEEVYKRVTENSPSHFLAWQNLLMIQNNQLDFGEMYEIASEASANFPNQPLFLLFRGIGASQTDRLAEAVKSLNDGLAININNPELTKQFYITLGDAYYQMDNYDEAFRNFENLLALDPDNALVLNNYSYYLSVLGRDLDKALEMIRKCIGFEPDNPTYLDTYAWVLFKLEEYEQALEIIGKVMELDQDPSGEVFEHYGDILYRNNRPEEAAKAWAKAMVAGGASDEIESKLESGLK